MNGRPGPVAAIIAFPVEREQWTNYGWEPARFRTVRAGSAGTFQIQRLPAGEYFLIAVNPAQIDAWTDPQFLAVASARATRVTLAWGDKKTQDLTYAEIVDQMTPDPARHGAASAVLAVAQQTPGRDADVRPTTGTASISGVVVTDETPPQPVRRVVVTLTGAELRPSRGAITDDEGRFALAGLPAGRFTLTAMRAGFVTSVYGAKRPGRPGTAVTLTAGLAQQVTVRLWRGAVIAGVLRDDTGEPVPNVPVTAVRVSGSGGGLNLTLTNNGGATNDRGEYRIFGLEPGRYLVLAPPVRRAAACRR